jgi:hypothetical protein
MEQAGRMRGWAFGVAWAGIALNLAAAATVLSLGVLQPDELRLDPWRAAVFIAILGASAVYGILAIGGRPALLSEAGLLSLLIAPVSMSGVTMVMVVPALLYLIARIASRARTPILPSIGRVLFAGGAQAAALAALIFLTQPRCITFDGGSSCTDAAVTALGAFVALASLGCAVYVSLAMSSVPDDVAEPVPAAL